jgi:hypothetical protein
MKQSPKTTSDIKRIGYLRQKPFVSSHPKFRGEVKINSVRKFEKSAHMYTPSGTHFLDRYEVDVTISGSVFVFGAKGRDWYTTNDLSDKKVYNIRRVNALIRTIVLDIIKTKLTILGFNSNICEIKRIKLV